MKRLVIITVGKTHSGKTTFARELEKQLKNSFVMDQDNHSVFINTYYKNLRPKEGPNTLKHSISNLIVDYAKRNTDFHFILCNSNRGKKGRLYLLEDVFPSDEFVRVLVHFDIPEDVLLERVIKSQRSLDILRNASNFEEVLVRQQAETLNGEAVDPIEGEADYLIVIRDNADVNSVIQKIVHIAESF